MYEGNGESPFQIDLIFFSINVGSEIRVKVAEMGTAGKGQKEMLWKTWQEVNYLKGMKRLPNCPEASDDTEKHVFVG